MKNATLLKTASLFIFLLSAQLSSGQNCSDYPNWEDYPSDTIWMNADEVHYNGKIYSPCYFSTNAPLSDPGNRDEAGCGTTNWGWVTDCSTGPAPTELFYEIFNDGQNATNGTDAYGTNWNTDEQSSSPDDFKVKNNVFLSKKTEGEAILFTETIDVGNYTDLKLSSFIDFGGNMESNDFIKFQYKLDGGVLTDVTNASYFGNNNDDTYEWPLTGITGTTLEIYITFDTDGGGEEHEIDNLKLTGVLDCSSASSEVTAAAANASNTQATVTWINPSADCITINEVLVVAKQGSDFSSATPSGNYSASTTFGSGDAFDGGTVVYSSGTAQSVSVTNLTDGAIYYFKIFTKTGSTWSSGVSVSAVCKENLFFEDFEDEAEGATTGTAIGNVSWSATTTASGYEESNVAEYSGDNSFWIELFNGNTTWTTNSIDISGHEDVNFSLYVAKYGTLESDDYIKTEYQIDGGAWTEAETNGSLNDDFASNLVEILVSQQNIEGDSLIIRVTAANNDNGNEEHFFDDILVQGQLKLPDCAINLAPTGNIQSLTPTLSWDAVSGATGYKVYYGEDSSTSFFVGETSSTSQVLPTLVNNTQYFWKVVPTNARGDASNCSAVSFTTIFPAPSCASYLSPTDSAIDVSLTPELSWSAVSGATGYKVYYSSDSSNLGDPITLGEITSYQLPQLGYNTQYFWKVVPTNAGGEATGCSVISFTTLKNPAGSVFITGNTVTVSKNAYLYLEKDFTNTGGSVTLNSSSTEFASIIVEGTASGNITYNRFVNYQAAGEWDIIGPPVLNQNMQSFAQTNTNNNTTSGAMAMGGDYYALGQYLTQWGSWANYTTSTIPDANFPAAKGYQMGTNSIGSGNDMQGQTLAFTGEIATTTQTINIQNQNGANGGNGRRWNLVANPFSSYINGNTNAGTTNGGTNFIDVNANVLDLEYTGLYYWDADEDGWDVFNQLQTNSDDGTLFIAPGQGFFVAARNSEVAQISFTPQMRTILGGDDFISGAPTLLNYKLDLKLFNGSTERAKTKFHFQQGLTLGLDAGYDAGAYNQATALSSRLPGDDQGVNFQINAMNLESAYNQTIPLVINQEVGQNFRVSISNNTLPEDVNVYLEDVQNGTLTSLKDQDFELSAQSDLSDAGRFYIRFTTQNLAVNDVLSPSTINVYKINTDSFITIKGLTPEMGKTTATIYNMLGMKVREKALDSSQSAQQISTQGLASGVYIINLKAGEQVVSKKVIIQ